MRLSRGTILLNHFLRSGTSDFGCEIPTNTGCFIPNTPIKQRGASAGNPRDMGGVGPVETNEEKASIVTH